MKRITHTSYTALVLEALRRADDFRTLGQLKAELLLIPDDKRAGRSNRISAALRQLKYYRCVDCLESDGQLWWFALLPADDTRSRVYTERAYEPNGRRRKRKAPKP